VRFEVLEAEQLLTGFSGLMMMMMMLMMIDMVPLGA
jgi:hypothetical protein